jgi:hypothetical protein
LKGQWLSSRGGFSKEGWRLGSEGRQEYSRSNFCMRHQVTFVYPFCMQHQVIWLCVITSSPASPPASRRTAAAWAARVDGQSLPTTGRGLRGPGKKNRSPLPLIVRARGGVAKRSKDQSHQFPLRWSGKSLTSGDEVLTPCVALHPTQRLVLTARQQRVSLRIITLRLQSFYDLG